MPEHIPDKTGNNSPKNGINTSNGKTGTDSLDARPNYNPTSLVGQVSVKDMGSRVTRESGGILVSQSRDSSEKEEFSTKENFNALSNMEFESINYRPTNKQNAANFENLTVEIRKHIPDELHSVILSAADAILECLKNEELSVEDKRTEIESLLSTKLDDMQMRELVVLTKEITDYDIQQNQDMEAGESETIAVVFEEDEVNEPTHTMEDPEVTTQTEEPTAQEEIQEEAKTITPGVNLEAKTILIHEVKRDFYFARLSALEPDTDNKEIVEVCKKISKSMANKDLGDQELEMALLETLDYKHLEFVKMCVENRWQIVYGLQLHQNREKALAEIRSENLDYLLDESNKRSRSGLLSDNQATKRTKLDLEMKEIPQRKPKIIDLEGLVFDQGHHLMANSKITLSKGSYQQNKKLYDIISVPAPPAPPSLESSNEKLVEISELPEWAQPAFPVGETSNLNRIQSKVFPSAFLSDSNILLCAPTGAGKTNVAMLTILRMLGNYRDDKSGKFDLKSFKAVYVAPLKALVSEQMREFQRRLTAQFGVVVNELTGDLSLSQKEIMETQKWDVVTRKATEESFTSLVKVLIIDEIHLLHDERGPVLESIIVRAKRQPETRLIGLSATLPNYQDVARFLGVDIEKGLFYFDALYRPCPLEQQYIGIKEKKAIKKVAAMNEACYEKLEECIKNRHQLIIFVHSRKDTVKTAKWLRDKAGENELGVHRSGAGTSEILRQEAENSSNKNLSEILPSGFGIHHAGLNKSDRSVVEDLFAQGHIQVLVSTATLAWGVNLPAHTVIIKGTDTYNPEKGAWVQLSPQDILQMLGRAGRPRYDSSGEGVIITAQEELQYYLAILNQQLPIESQLMSRLADNLNAEVVLGSVTSREDAIEWLGQTYLYIRMLSAPKLYQVGIEYADDGALYWKRADLVHSALVLLQQHKLVMYDAETGDVQPTELGKIAAHFYISYPTMGAYNTELKLWMSEMDVLRIFAGSGEFKYVPVRQEEKMEVSKLADKCPIPIKENASDPLAKINVLLQTYISRLRLEGFALMADMVYVTQSAGRLLRAIHQICLKKKWAKLTLITLELCKFVERRMWNTNSPFRQFGELASAEIIRATEASHLPFISYFDLSGAELAEAINFKGHTHKTVEIDFFVPIADPLAPAYYVTFTSEKWLNSQWRIPVKMFNMKIPKKPSSPTDLLDVQTVPIEALKNEVMSATFDFSYFNGLQSQCFRSLWETSQNIFIGAPKGSGKTACAELAILNAWRLNKQRILYLQPSQELVDRQLKIWKRKFSSLTEPAKVISKLTGDATADARILSRSHLVLATPSQFDVVSRRWRQRKAIQTLDLIVADDLQLLGSGFSGVAYEVVLSRLRFIAAHLEREIRFVALSMPLLYGREIGEWLGCSKSSIFNFNPSKRIRSIQEIRLQPYSDLKNLNTLAHSCANFLKTTSSCLVFVPTRSNGLELASRLLELSSVNFVKYEEKLDLLIEKVEDATLKHTLRKGVGIYQENMSIRDKLVTERAFEQGLIRLLIATRATAVYAPHSTNVVIYGTQGNEILQSSDYSITELLEMVGYSPLLEILNSPLPLESNLSFSLHDPFMHEIAARTFRSQQDCVDWITFTLFYRRLAQNPSFYSLVDVTHLGISEYLSDLVENTLNDLSEAGLIEIEDEKDSEESEESEEAITPLNGAMISSHYDVTYTSMKNFGELSGKARLRNIIEAVTSAGEFDDLPARANEYNTLASIASKVPFKLTSDSDFDSPHVKAFLLLQAHLSRIPVKGSLEYDQHKLLGSVLKLVNACVDTLSSEGHLNALTAMDLSQMIVQGMWNKESPVRQIPHVNEQMLQRAKKYNVETIYDIMSLEDDERDDFLQLSEVELHDVADFVNSFPNIDVRYELDVESGVVANEPKSITVIIDRDEEMDDLTVASLRFPFSKTEGWWIVVGDSETRQLYAIKKTQVKDESQSITLEFTIPNPGHHKITLWCMCDSYIDADKEMEFEVDVGP
ncbi:CIC11C00000000239 [Sungouiella intermedia]|uniref:U5 small nuclear ribonucleoprotein 200 kDa helicase n=1 Tax=Sungouiella intermedia TaxID=45354 RepID=A0A1L0BF89_9ASCO|nr:CIC11C00000000239 [[Candida] intermedia]